MCTVQIKKNDIGLGWENDDYKFDENADIQIKEKESEVAL